jgi:hypothetical protein
MRSASNNFRSRPFRLALTAGVVGAALSACSQDTSRFNDDPFTNPFSSRSDVTNSVSSSAGRVESRPLAGPQSQGAYTPPPNYDSNAPRTVPAAPAQTYRPQGQASYEPAITGSNPPGIRGGDAGWASDGGTAVTLQQGESVETVARRYGVPVSAILRANNFSDTSRITPGMRIVIPTYQGVGPSHAQASQPPQQTYNPPALSTTDLHTAAGTAACFGSGRGNSHGQSRRDALFARQTLRCQPRRYCKRKRHSQRNGFARRPAPDHSRIRKRPSVYDHTVFAAAGFSCRGARADAAHGCIAGACSKGRRNHACIDLRAR